MIKQNIESYLMNNQRIRYIDRMKGFAILLVVIGHILLFSLDMGNTVPYRFIASCHMHFFMFISGFVAYFNFGGGNRLIMSCIEWNG